MEHRGITERFDSVGHNKHALEQYAKADQNFCYDFCFFPLGCHHHDNSDDRNQGAQKFRLIIWIRVLALPLAWAEPETKNLAGHSGADICAHNNANCRSQL